MKRFLLTTASAVVLGMAAPAMGQGRPDRPEEGLSESWIEQIGSENSATVTQSSSASGKETGNLSIIDQGSHNTAKVDQSGSGTLNTSIIEQADWNNGTNELTGEDVDGARVVQKGNLNRNTSKVTQKTTTKSKDIGNNTADVLQDGTGIANESVIIQDGFANAVIVWQDGDGGIKNSSNVTQSGSNNSAHVIQK
jgi:hypothetical protein